MCEILYYDQKNVKGVEASGTDFNALIAMYVKGVESGVRGFYATLHTEHRFNGMHVKGIESVLYMQRPLTPP